MYCRYLSIYLSVYLSIYIYIYLYIRYTCSMHIIYIIRVIYIYYTCIIHIFYIYYTYILHLFHIYYTCIIHILYIYYTHTYIYICIYICETCHVWSDTWYFSGQIQNSPWKIHHRPMPQWDLVVIPQGSWASLLGPWNEGMTTLHDVLQKMETWDIPSGYWT